MARSLLRQLPRPGLVCRIHRPNQLSTRRHQGRTSTCPPAARVFSANARTASFMVSSFILYTTTKNFLVNDAFLLLFLTYLCYVFLSVNMLHFKTRVVY